MYRPLRSKSSKPPKNNNGSQQGTRKCAEKHRKRGDSTSVRRPNNEAYVKFPQAGRRAIRYEEHRADSCGTIEPKGYWTRVQLEAGDKRSNPKRHPTPPLTPLIPPQWKSSQTTFQVQLPPTLLKKALAEMQTAEEMLANGAHPLHQMRTDLQVFKVDPPDVLEQMRVAWCAPNIQDLQHLDPVQQVQAVEAQQTAGQDDQDESEHVRQERAFQQIHQAETIQALNQPLLPTATTATTSTFGSGDVDTVTAAVSDESPSNDNMPFERMTQPPPPTSQVEDIVPMPRPPPDRSHAVIHALHTERPRPRPDNNRILPRGIAFSNPAALDPVAYTISMLSHDPASRISTQVIGGLLGVRGHVVLGDPSDNPLNGAAIWNYSPNDSLLARPGETRPLHNHDLPADEDSQTLSSEVGRTLQTAQGDDQMADSSDSPAAECVQCDSAVNGNRETQAVDVQDMQDVQAIQAAVDANEAHVVQGAQTVPNAQGAQGVDIEATHVVPVVQGSRPRPPQDSNDEQQNAPGPNDLSINLLFSPMVDVSLFTQPPFVPEPMPVKDRYTRETAVNQDMLTFDYNASTLNDSALADILPDTLFESSQLDTVLYGNPLLDSMPLPGNSPFGGLQQNIAQFGSVQQGAMQFGGMQLGDAQFGSVQQVDAPLGSMQHNKVPFGNTQQASAQLGIKQQVISESIQQCSNTQPFGMQYATAQSSGMQYPQGSTQYPLLPAITLYPSPPSSTEEQHSGLKHTILHNPYEH